MSNNNVVDYSKNFWNHNRYPVYRYDNLKKVVENEKWTIEKIPMFVDGSVVWTHFKVTLKPRNLTEPFATDVSIRLTILEGSMWLLINYKGKNGGNIIEAGDIVIIPENATFTIANQSASENCVYTLDANTLLEMEG